MTDDDDDLGVVLTQRELEILQLVAGGYSAKEIARRVAIAPRTVERHIENARLKMRARNRAHMVTCAMALGLINTVARISVPLTAPGPAMFTLESQGSMQVAIG